MPTLDHFEYQWYYMVNDIWFEGPGGQVGDIYPQPNCQYNGYPDYATQVKIIVKPVSKKYKASNDTEKSYWTGENVSAYKSIRSLPPETLSTPEVEIKKYNLTAKIENITDARTDEVQFRLYEGNNRIAEASTTVVTARASHTFQVSAGKIYRVRCRAVNIINGSRIYGEWSPYSIEVGSIPAAPTNVKVSVETDKSVKVTWKACSTATGYTVEYATNKLYFDSSNDVTVMSVKENYAIITGIEPGHEWYFRVQATNDHGDSGYSNIVCKVVGTKPEPPTTWTLTSTAIIGDPVVLYWVHNSEDGSKQNEAQIELTINGTGSIITIDTSNDILDPDEISKIYTYTLNLSEYPDGAKILWRVRTKGVLNEFSDWSIQRTIDTYAPPTMILTLGDNSGELVGYPFTIIADVGPDQQKAVSYHMSIKSLFTHVTRDRVGNEIVVNAGDEVYSKVFIQSGNDFSFDLLPQDLSLENNQSYEIKMVAAMDSGLSAEASGVINVNWGEFEYIPEATVTIDRKQLCAYISPWCMDDNGDYIPDVVLSVYRVEYDGTFTEIKAELDNVGSSSITDPHPSLDFARYRIVARHVSTNVIGYTDLPAEPVNEPAIVIQWNETWSNAYIDEDANTEVPFVTGNMLKLPYNVDVSESNKTDASLISYIGRKSPVSYYGTLQEVTASWSTEIPKSDKETIYTLRKLSVWPGDVYVREPNGMGYNANITVSLDIKHKEVTVPVSIEVTKVEGGI